MEQNHTPPSGRAGSEHASAVSIRLEGVSAHFRHAVKGDIAAVDDVSLIVQPGELVTLLGPSGCGKTTTLRMIAGFQQPSRGKVWIGERDVTHAESQDRNAGFVFQNYALFPHLSIFENVAYGLRVQRRDKHAVHDAVTRVLGLVGLAGYERQMPHQLSGGEQQRVALARAIVIEPRVLLFDEPLSNLDAKLRVQMRGDIRTLQQRVGITAVYVTHDQEEAMAISDRIAVMSRGRIEQVGTAPELYRRPASAFVATFIGRSNLVPCTVTDVGAQRTALTLLGGRHEIVDAPADARAGSAMTAVIRPESLRLAASGDAGIAATVTSRVYLGDKIEYVVDAGGTLLEVAHSDPRGETDYAPGDRVSLDLPQRGIHLIAPEDA